jgi:uncharacterized membrane protein
MASLFSRLGASLTLFLFLAIIAASTVAFMLNFESVLKVGHFGPLIVVILAAAMFLSAVRGMCTSGGTNAGPGTIAFLFVMCGTAALGAYAGHDHIMRLTLRAVSLVLLVVAAFYSMRYARRRSQGSVVSDPSPGH